MKTENKIQAKTRYQVADEYGVHCRTLHRWLLAKGIHFDSKKLLRPIELEVIYSTFGKPFSESQPEPVGSSVGGDNKGYANFD